MIKSMTGFGRGEFQKENVSFSIEIKTVNHRYCDIFVKMPRHLGFMEDKVKRMISHRLSRGKVEVYISYDNCGEDSKSVILDEGLANTYIGALKSLRDKFDLKDDISVSLIAKFPDILSVEKKEEDEDEMWNILKEAVNNGLDSLINMREVEGEKLKTDLLGRTDYIDGIISNIEKRAPLVVLEYKERLESRLNELLEQKVVDETRLAAEIAIFADRCNIDEELVRFKSHCSQLRQTLEADQPIGRKLDFLIQEINREINTIGSKANDLEITKNVVEVKSEIEKIREQVQNIE